MDATLWVYLAGLKIDKPELSQRGNLDIMGLQGGPVKPRAFQHTTWVGLGVRAFPAAPPAKGIDPPSGKVYNLALEIQSFLSLHLSQLQTLNRSVLFYLLPE